jgi:two-component system, cell cycle sensor histidine kinase and response regulator CckA
MINNPPKKRPIKTAKDITKSKPAKKITEQSERKYKALIDTTGTGYVTLNSNGNVLNANPEYVRLTGHTSLDEIAGRSVVEWTAPHHREKNSREVKKCLENGFVRNLEIDYIDQTGHITPIEINATLFDSTEGRQILTLVRDITERKKAEKILQKNRSDLMVILDNLPFLAWLKDSEGHFIAVNVPFAQASGHSSPEDLIGKTDLDIWPKHLAESYRADDNTVMSGRKKKAVEEIISDQGVNRWFETYKAPLFDVDGKVTGTTGFARDISERKRAEEALRESEGKYRILVDNIPQKIFSKDRHSVYISCNENYARDLGIKAEEIIGKTDYNFYPKEFAEKYRSDDKNVMDSGETKSFEEQYMQGNAKAWIYTVKTPIRDKEGKIAGILGVFSDITERKHMEEQLHESEKRFRTLFEESNVSIIIHDKDSGEVIDANNNTLERYGINTLGELKTNDFWMEPPYSFREALEWIHKASSEGPQRFEWLNRKATGELFWEDVLLTKITLNGAERILATTIDISNRKKAEETLRISEEKYRLLFENASDAIFVAQDEKVIFPNPQLSRLLGFTYEELNGTPFRNFIHPDDADMVVERHKKRLKGDSVPGTYSFRAVTKSGEILWVEVSKVLITWEGRPATLSFLRDITQQRKMEEQLLHAQKMEAIGTLAGGVAHDFNNLLMGILGYTSLMLMKTDKTHPFYEKLKTIESQVESGAELTKQLLGFARGGKYEVKTVNVNDLVIKTSDIFGRTKKEITIHKKLQEDLYSIEADSGQIEQVMFNLYVNAWQAMPSGGRLYLETQNAIIDEQQGHSYNVGPGIYVKISVTDTGVGMDAETQKRIFEPFFSTKGVGKGTGLGLASAYGIIRNHGGIINVYSEKGHGTTLILYLPASGAKAAEAKTNEDTLLTGHETILLVDDEPINIVTTKELLEALGYNILTALSGKEAIKLYREHFGKIQLVILDMIMPEMNGKETLTKLMETDKNVCVLLSSGYSIDGEAKSILDLGCKSFIQKPFRIEELSKKMRDVLDRKAS